MEAWFAKFAGIGFDRDGIPSEVKQWKFEEGISYILWIFFTLVSSLLTVYGSCGVWDLRRRKQFTFDVIKTACKINAQFEKKVPTPQVTWFWLTQGSSKC